MLICFSCTDPRYGKADEQIQKFRSQLNKYKEDFEKVDTTELNQIARTIKSGIDSIEILAVENKWVLEKEEAEFLTNYKSIAAPAKMLSEKAQILHSDLIYSEKQLATLQTDIQKRSQPIDSVLKYLKVEEEALKTIAKSTQNMVEGNQVLKARYQLLYPQYNYYVSRIRTRE